MLVRNDNFCVGSEVVLRGRLTGDFMKNIIDKITSRKLAVTAAVGAAAATGAVDLTWPMAAVVCCYLVSQAIVDARVE
jgi:hypothetical protein